MALIELGNREREYIGFAIYIGLLVFFTYATVKLWGDSDPVIAMLAGISGAFAIFLWLPILLIINSRLGIIANK